MPIAIASSPLALRFTARATAPQRYAGMLGDAHYVLAEVPIKTRGMARPMPRAVGLLWDASGSGRKRDHAGEFAVLDRYFRAMGDGRVQLRLLRDVGEDGGTFEVRGGDWSALRAVLASVVYDGATDLADWAPMRGVDEYLRLRASHAAQTGTAAAKPVAAVPEGLSGAELRAAQKELTAIERRLEKLAGQIDTAHQRLAEHDQGDYEGLQRLTGSLRELEGEVTELEERWMELSEEVQ